MKILPKNNVYNKTFTVFGHRGAPYLAPENTLKSFKIAIELKYDAIELDVVLTKDNIPIVHHDKHIKIDSKKKNIVDLSYEEILKFLNHAPPKLDDILGSIGHQININVEIKDQGRGYIKITEKVINSLKKFNLIDNIVISCFNPQFIKYVKKTDDRFATAWIWGPKNLYFFNHWRIVLNYFNPQAIHIKHELISSKLISKVKAQNIKVLAYTVNKKEILLNMISKKIDGVFTDSPAILKLAKHQDPQSY